MNLSVKIKVMAVKALAAAALVAMPLMSNPSQATGARADAAATYKAKCAACHGVDGSGQTAKGKEMKLRDLRSPEVQKLSDEQLYNITAKGKGKMPGYEKSLGADQLKQLVAYMREPAKKS
jgi:mono/diheme cytochrome c family protein